MYVYYPVLSAMQYFDKLPPLLPFMSWNPEISFGLKIHFQALAPTLHGA
jgi:hypothetical protein